MTHVERFGHSFEPRKGHGCKLCHRARERERRRCNPEAARARAREYARQHPAEARERAKAWKDRNPERFRRYHREKERLVPAEVKRERKRRSYHKDIAMSRAYVRTSQMRRHGNREAAQYAELVRRDPCSYCGRPGGQADHIEPLNRDGLHDAENLTGACRSCNSAKGDRPLLAFLLYRTAA